VYGTEKDDERLRNKLENVVFSTYKILDSSLLRFVLEVIGDINIKILILNIFRCSGVKISEFIEIKL
jgi:hypothetical protein